MSQPNGIWLSEINDGIDDDEKEEDEYEGDDGDPVE